MKETQIIIIVFLILGIFAVYFFSQSTLFQEENVEINNEVPLLQPIKDDVSESNVGPNQSYLRNSTQIIPNIEKDPEAEPNVINENINQVNAEKPPDVEIMSEVFTCSKSNFVPQINDYIIYDIIGLEKLSVIFSETYENEVNVTLTITNINSTWFIADLESRAIISGPDDGITGSVPLFWLPVHYKIGDTVTNLGDIELKISDEDSMLFDGKKIDTIIVTGMSTLENQNNKTESLVKSYYEKNTGILLQITEESTIYKNNEVVDQQIINIITVIETNIEFNKYSIELIQREVNTRMGSFVIYELDNFDWKFQISEIMGNSANITESRRFPGADWELIRWRVVDLGCLIIKDASTTSFDNNFQRSSNIIGKSYEFIIRNNVLIGNYIFPAYEEIGLGPEIFVFKIIGFTEFEQNGDIINAIVAESIGEGGIVRRYFDQTTGILLLEEFEYEGTVRQIIRLKEISA